MKIRIAALRLIPALLLLSGCVTHITTDITQNPPPLEKFSNFTRFELTPVALAAPYAGDSANERALNKIQENVAYNMNPVLAKWRATGMQNSAVSTLLIQPEITEIKFVSVGKRIWSMAFSGSSAVILQATITDKATGRVIATPQFFAKAAAMGGWWTVGTTDNLMLTRVADRFTDYLEANYHKSEGGPTGAEPPSK